MAAHVAEYPSAEAEAFVRGDPASFIVRISVQGVDEDITTWDWRCHIRAKFDSIDPVSVCEDFAVVAPDDLPGVFEDASTVPCVLLARFTGEQTALWKLGYVSDVEALAPTKHTWIIIDRLRVDKDATHTEVLP